MIWWQLESRNSKGVMEEISENSRKGEGRYGLDDLDEVRMVDRV